MTAPDPRLEEIEGRLSKSVTDAQFGDVLRIIWATYYFGADLQWHNARTGDVEQAETLAAEIEASDGDWAWLGPAADVAYLLAELRKAQDKLAAVSILAETWRYKGEFGWGAWQEGQGPDQEGTILDDASRAIRAAVADATGGERG